MRFHQAFFDELAKLSAAPSDSVMRSVLKRDPSKEPQFPAKDRTELIHQYRRALNTSNEYPAHLKHRLESFKHWKRTGQVPAVSVDRKTQTVSGVNKPSSVDRPMDWSNSSAPVAVVHHGGSKNISKVTQQPRTKLDRHYIVPGHQSADRVGAYFSNPGHSKEFAGYKGGAGKPAKVVAAVPTKAILRSPAGERPESILPAQNAHNVLAKKVFK